MNLPSITRLEDAFPSSGIAVRKLLELDHLVNKHPAVTAWESECFHRPKLQERRMCALNAELSGHGVEAIFGDSITVPDMTYVNMGDSYATTIIYDYVTGTYKVQSLADWLEKAERAGREYA